jgi:hypothetical protein
MIVMQWQRSSVQVAGMRRPAGIKLTGFQSDCEVPQGRLKEQRFLEVKMRLADHQPKFRAGLGRRNRSRSNTGFFFTK